MKAGRTQTSGRSHVRAAMIGAVALVSMVLVLQLTGLWRPVSIALEGIVNPVGTVLSSMTRSTGEFFRTLGSLSQLGTQNRALESELQLAQAEVSRLKEVERENRLLREQTGFQQDVPLETLGAKVIAYGPDNVRRTIVMNRGSRDGVEVGQAVVSSGILVGRIVRVDHSSAVVGLVSDPEFRLQAVGQSGRARGILSGEIGAGLRLSQIAQNEVLERGENILTAGSDRVPRGILIGTVEYVDRSDNEIFQAATIRSPLNFERLELVFVVKN